MNPVPDSLLRHPRIFRLAASAGAANPGLPTGYPELDACLPGGGWPRAALNEILVDGFGSCELQLVIPALVSLCAEGTGEAYWLTWISPPHIPYAPALAAAGLDLARILMVRTRRSQDALWAAEQALRSGTCRAVLVWSEQVDSRRLRRLQLAAEEGNCPGFVFRPDAAKKRPSPAALRLRIAVDDERPQLDLLKVRGGRPAQVSPAGLC